MFSLLPSLETDDNSSKQAGHLLAYRSNKNAEAVNIRFDDFEVFHANTSVVQTIDHYPWHDPCFYNPIIRVKGQYSDWKV